MFEAIQKRKSVRDYKDKSVPKEIVKKILEAGRVAPSASNIQPWHFIVVSDLESRKVIAKGPYAKFVRGAPLVIVGCGDTKMSPNRFMMDVSIALENMVLAATGEGLGTCWICGFYEDQVKKLLAIPEHYKVVALLSVGYPRQEIDVGRTIPKLARERKTLGEIASAERFGNPFC